MSTDSTTSPGSAVTSRTSARRPARGTFVVGVLCLLSGIAVILVASGALSAGSVAVWLPAALIVAGVAGLVMPRGARS